MKANKTKLLDGFVLKNHPWFIQNEDKSIDKPVNTMDCIRIFDKLEELKKEPDADPILMTLLHLAKINLKDMTVVMDNNTSQIHSLVKGETYERPRGEQTLRADASNCNLKGKWPTDFGAYAKLWARIVKGAKRSI